MGRLRGCLWLTAGLLVALVAAVVGYMAISRAAATRSGGGVDTAQVDVVVAAAAVPVRTVLTDDMVRVQRMAVSTVPEGALQTDQPGDRQDHDRGALSRRAAPDPAPGRPQRHPGQRPERAAARRRQGADGVPRRRSDEQGGGAAARRPRGSAGDARLPARRRGRGRRRGEAAGDVQPDPKPDHRRDRQPAERRRGQRKTHPARRPRCS